MANSAHMLKLEYFFSLYVSLVCIYVTIISERSNLRKKRFIGFMVSVHHGDEGRRRETSQFLAVGACGKQRETVHNMGDQEARQGGGRNDVFSDTSFQQLGLTS